jgi:hypothetical protein
MEHIGRCVQKHRVLHSANSAQHSIAAETFGVTTFNPKIHYGTYCNVNTVRAHINIFLASIRHFIIAISYISTGLSKFSDNERTKNITVSVSPLIYPTKKLEAKSNYKISYHIRLVLHYEGKLILLIYA